MEILTLVSLDILFLILVGWCLSLDARHRRHTERLRCITERYDTALAELQARLDDVTTAQSPGNEADEEQLKARLAEKRFTDGIASILAYDFAAGTCRQEGGSK